MKPVYGILAGLVTALGISIALFLHTHNPVLSIGAGCAVGLVDAAVIYSIIKAQRRP